VVHAPTRHAHFVAMGNEPLRRCARAQRFSKLVGAHVLAVTRRLLIFEGHSANRKTPAETAQILLDAMTFPDEEGEESYFHDEIVWADDTPDGKQQMAVYRRDFHIRIRPARKARMRRLSYEWLAGLREIVIDPFRCPKTFEEFTLKEYLRDPDGSWVDEIPDGNDHSIDAVRNAILDDCLRG